MDTENNTNKDIFDDEFEDNSVNLHNILTIGAILVAISVFIALSWYAYNSFKKATDAGSVPTISADSSPTKIIPQDKGGMKFPNMDKEIYSKISPKSQEQKVERILPGPEEPIDKNLVVKAEKKANDEISSLAKMPENADLKTNEVIAKDVSKHDVTKTAVETEKDNIKISSSDILPSEHKQVAEDMPKIANDLIKNLPKGSKFAKSDYKTKGHGSFFRVQIASFKTEKDAEKEWNSREAFKKTNLAQYNHFIEKKNLPGKGLVYRLQVGEFKTESEASELCKKLKASSVDCFTLRP